MSFNISVPEELIQDVSDQNVIVSGHSQLVDVSCQHLDVSGGLQVDGHSQLLDVSCQHLDVSGGLQVDGHSQLVDVSCQHLDVSGNVILGGTLAVTGDSQLVNINCVSLTVGDTNEGIINGKDVNHAIHLRKDGNNETAIHEYGYISFYTDGLLANQTEKMRITSAGYVGIGTTSPGLPLEVQSASTTGSSITGSRRYLSSGGVSSIESGNVGTSNRTALFRGEMWVDGIIISNNGTSSFSDSRIKKNISDISDNESLNILRLLKPKKYQYIDKVNKGESYVYGFIAQEVGDILSYSILQEEYKIPNIYQVADVCDNQLILQNQFTLEYDASNQLYKTLYLYDENDLIHKVEIIDFSNQIISISGEITGNQMFVYGQEVDNLHILKKDAIWTISTAALQEVDRQLQEEKTKVSTLETQYNTLETQYNTLQSQYNDLLSRVSALENST